MRSDYNGFAAGRSLAKLVNGYELCVNLSDQTFLVRGKKIAKTPNSGRYEHRVYTYSMP